MLIQPSPARLAFAKAEAQFLAGRFAEAKRALLAEQAAAHQRRDRGGEALLLVAVANATECLVDADAALPRAGATAQGPRA